MKGNTIAKLAVAGLLTGAIATSTACKNAPDETAEPAATETTPDEKPAEVEAPAESAPAAEGDGAAAAAGELHDCAGKNSCKGMGGCAVTAEKLTELASAAGVDAAKTGEAHDCGGKNSCKGLGGCKVDAEKLAKMKGGDKPAGDMPAEGDEPK